MESEEDFVHLRRYSEGEEGEMWRGATSPEAEVDREDADQLKRDSRTGEALSPNRELLVGRVMSC